MNKKQLDNVTLLGIDCIDIDRLILAADICMDDFEFSDVKLLTSLPSPDHRVVTINHIASTEDYSRFVLENLDKHFNTEHVLVIQYDGFILNPKAWSDDYLNYDYIGAPWLTDNTSVNKFGFRPELLGQYVVGNGGFSLRSKKLTSLCSRLVKENFFSNIYHPEDVVLCVKNRLALEKLGINFAPIDLAKKFSYESFDIDDYSWTDQFGFHGLEWTDISKWLDMHPEYKNKIHNDISGHLSRLKNSVSKNL